MRARFDHFADWAADMVASVWFFVFCLLTVLVWMPSLPLFKDTESWQLPINTFTTVVTFLMLALLHNTQHRFEQRTDERAKRIDDDTDWIKEQLEILVARDGG